MEEKARTYTRFECRKHGIVAEVDLAPSTPQPISISDLSSLIAQAQSHPILIPPSPLL
jgi:hypothetical protein